MASPNINPGHVLLAHSLTAYTEPTSGEWKSLKNLQVNASDELYDKETQVKHSAYIIET